MDLTKCTGQPPATHNQACDITDDFMFGFDIKDDEDKKYLAELAMRRIGHEDDIQSFVGLSLLRGVEEWEQAISCASSMRDRSFAHNSLDGQDVLAFLAKLYGVNSSWHTTYTRPPSQRPGRVCIGKKQKRARGSLDAEIPVEIPAKRKRQVQGSKDSPYWAETSVSGRRDGQTGNWSEIQTTAKNASTKGKSWSGGTVPQFSSVAIRRTGNCAATQAHKHTQLASAALNKKYEPLRGGPFPVTQELSGPPIDGDIKKAPGEPSLTQPISKPGTSVIIPRLDPLQPNSESQITNGLAANTSRANTGPDNETKEEPAAQIQTPKRKSRSPYFEASTKATPSPPKRPKSPNKRPLRGTVSSLPFPPLDSPRFGLIQEELADDPFRLLIAVTFLIRTTGRAAIPAFRALVDRYPTPRDLAAADARDVTALIGHLGLGAVRAAKIQRYARTWVADPPRNGVRHAVRNYPSATATAGGAGGLTGTEESSSLEEAAWEIGHLTQGPYALDSWRIFCRDALRGAAADWQGGGREGAFQPEWMRVLPRDKELRACLRWMWMREGWQWDPATGDKVVLPADLRRAVQEGRVGYDDAGDLRILGADADAPASESSS